MFHAAPACWGKGGGGGGRSRAVCCSCSRSRRRSRFSWGGDCVASDDDTTPPPTVADPAATGWAINDPVVRFRVLGSERVFDLATSDRWVLGSSPECSLHLDDPSGRVSRRHAVASREGEFWT